MSAPLPRTLFVGRGAGSVCWYRCALPAMALGAEWVGVTSDPPTLGVKTGVMAQDITHETLFTYDVVVLQQPIGPPWVRTIRELQAAGVSVLFEIDDYVQAIRKMTDHEFAGTFGKEVMAAYELSMAICDGLVVSTEWLARKYRAFNANVHVCRNGLDLKRYAVSRPAHDGVTVGWAGGTGHGRAFLPWMAEVAQLMRERADVGLTTVGQGFAAELQGEFGPERARVVPFGDLNAYPAAMTLFDVALAPAGKGNFFRGKSDLRWLEASALGIPTIADPDVYPEIEHGVTGFHASTPQEAGRHLRALVADPELRARVGAAAKAHVIERRSIEVAAQAWERAIRAAAPSAAGAAEPTAA